MTDPRQGRASAGGFSPRLGRRDPRLRTNASGAVTDNDLDRATISRDGSGRQRISAADELKPLPASATTGQVRDAYNMLLKRLRGQ